ncbi:hypothetical protein [Shewanella xiamenensis]|uniref:hypothetical protein n=1 Tax=Shewanella xiamenensis TaxID=332186 RepID=UPI00217EBD94|nr:hypothetical protein [Shewanella xiamenensis]MCT8871596.1 hypothetical protein [Shewanella xiamenensis]UWH43567.1 hypothetical protein KXJ80_10170 [Shewanella xiamenensis]
MTTKRRVLLDGNGSSQINVEGLGVYVPASELAQLKQMLGTEIQQLTDQVRAMELDRSTHIDDIGIDRFTNAMRLKMSYSRAKGRSGWDDPAQCSGEQLAAALVEHLSKGNAGTFEDVANFAMMLHQRKESPSLLADAVNETRAKAVMNFAEVNRGAYLSGFVTADLTVYDVYQSARNHVKDNYGYDTKPWVGDDADKAKGATCEIIALALESINPIEFVAMALRHTTVSGEFDYQDVKDAFKYFADGYRQAAKDGAR